MPHLTGYQTIYVNDTTGDDSNPNTQDEPFVTIQAAVESLQKDLGMFIADIEVVTGTYDELAIIRGFSGRKHNL